MSDTLKFAYTTGNVFALTGSYFTGFYNVSAGTAYVGKYHQNTPLQSSSNIQNAVILSDKFFNRIVTENITLTYTLSDFIFQPNEYINTNSINLKLEKAFDNFLDTYRACFFATSQLPYKFVNNATASATSAGNSIVWYGSNTRSSITPLSSFDPNITRNSKIAYYTNVNPASTGDCTLIVATLSTLFTFLVNSSAGNTTFNFVFSSSRVETNNAQGYNQLTFSNISSIAKSKNTFYVCDAGNNSIYSYDITSVLNEDRALGYTFSLTNSINQSQGQFITPTLVAASNTTVYVYDSSTGIITYFDKNFNIVNNYGNSQYFSQHPPVYMAYYRLTDSLYVLTSDYNLVVLDSQANSTFYSFNYYSYAYNENPLKIVFSNTNSDIFYLLTNRGVYKKFISNCYNNIGNFSFTSSITGTNSTSYNVGQDPFTYFYDMDTFEDDNNFDNLMVYGYDQFLNYNEQTLFNSLLK